jgi:hypothetical protein
LLQQTRFVPAATKAFHALRDGNPFYAPSANGGKVLSDKRLTLYARWFEEHANGATAINDNNFSLSTNGIAIKGFQVTTIEQILSLPKIRDEIDNRLKTVFNEIDNYWEGEEKQLRNKKFNEAKCAIISGLKDLCDTSGRAMQIAENALRNAAGVNDDKIIKKLNEANAAINANPIKEIASFLVPRAELIEASVSTPKEKTFTHLLEFQSKLYRAIYENAKFNLDVVKL